MIRVKHLLVIGACCLVTQAVHAQYPKYVVQFTDKNNSPYSLSNPSAYLSAKAIDRRMRYNIAIDSTDLPVNPKYINKVLAKGAVTYLSQSKWINQVLIYCTSAATIDSIRTLKFVKKVSPVGQLVPDGSNPDRFKETVTPLNITEKVQKTTDSFNYGNSYKQVHIHNGEFLHKKGFTGNGITIAILDAGFYKYKTIKAFDSARAHGQFLGEKDFVDFDNSVNEDYDHGEYCLSTIAANVPGVMVGTAPNASFYLLRSEDVNSELPIEEHNWAAAAEYADSCGADMISSSLGYYQFDNAAFNHTYNDFYKNTAQSTQAATFATRKGMIVTNSAGNEGASSWKYIIFPSDGDSVCAVAATDVNGNIAYFSSYGYPGRVKPNIASVGSGTTVYTSFGVSTASGTSFSNPNINGLIACLWQAFPQANNVQILKAVYASSDRARTPDNRFGYGLPNMRKAYIILKRAQNNKLYGEQNTVFATSSNGNIAVKFIGQQDGEATISLVDKTGKMIASKKLTIEEQEVNDISFSAAVAGSSQYFIQYSDGKTAVKVPVSIVNASRYNQPASARPIPAVE